MFLGGKEKKKNNRVAEERPGEPGWQERHLGVWGYGYLLTTMQVSSTIAWATACAVFCTSGMSALGVIDSNVECSSAPHALLEWTEKETFSQRKSLHFMTGNLHYKICWEFTLIFFCQFLKSYWSLYKSFWILVLGRVVQIAVRETRIAS